MQTLVLALRGTYVESAAPRMIALQGMKDGVLLQALLVTDALTILNVGRRAPRTCLDE